MIVGLTAYANRGHIARAALEAAAWQSREVVDAANAVADVPFTELRVDGGMTANELLMQFQADVLGVPVIRPKVTETTALGAAYAAGLATGFWSDQAELKERWAEDKRWEPRDGREATASASTRAGRRPSSARWTGSTRTQPTAGETAQIAITVKLEPPVLPVPTCAVQDPPPGSG